MGDEKDKKPAPAGPKPADKDDAKTAVNLRELDDAYESVRDAQEVLFNNRVHGAEEVHKALNEADPPSLANELLKTLIIAGLGYASGGIAAGIAGSVLAKGASDALTNAVSTAIDDGIKDAATKIATHLAQPNGGSSMSEYFTSQKVGVESLRLSAYDEIRAQKTKASGAVSGADEQQQAGVLEKKVAEAKATRKATDENVAKARSLQFRGTLTNWMNAMSRGQMGTDKDKGPGEGATDLFGSKGTKGRDPADFYKHQGAKGVIYAAFGSRSAGGRPFSVSGGGTGFGQIPTIKIAGMTESAKERLHGIPIKDLGMPIIASGYVYDGFLDGLVVSDNSVSFGKNEAGTVFTSGQEDGWSAMRKATGQSENTAAARIVLDNDIGVATLDNALTSG